MWGLFLSHLILEKLLKAIYAKEVDTNIPYTHDLTKIAEMAKYRNNFMAKCKKHT